MKSLWWFFTETYQTSTKNFACGLWRLMTECTRKGWIMTWLDKLLATLHYLVTHKYKSDITVNWKLHSCTSRLMLVCSQNVDILNWRYTPRVKKYPNMKIMISQKCANIFSVNLAHLFTRQLCKSMLLCAVFTWHTPNWQKYKLQERILQLFILYKRLILLIK